jgi:glutamyl-tRNA reductase
VIRRRVVAFVTHARQVPATERQRFTGVLRADPHARALIIETCHRVEAYTTGEVDAAPPGLVAALPAGGRLLVGDAAVRHVVAVATGRDSVVLGEDQILHQLRESLEAARTAGTLDPEIDRLFALALRAGRRSRSWRSGHQRSLADVALQVVEQRQGPVRGHEILVVGAGRMGHLMARAAASSGAAVTVANRSSERARAMAASIGGRTMDLDPGPQIGRFAAIFVALGGPWAIAPTAQASILEHGAAVVDLSVPSAIPAPLTHALGDRLVTADDLASHEAGGPGDDPMDARSEELIEQTVRAYLEWQALGDARAAADALVRRADRERQAELEVLWRKLPTLEPEAREAIEGMTRHLAARLLRQPLERLGRDTDDVDGRAVRDLFAL